MRCRSNLEELGRAVRRAGLFLSAALAFSSLSVSRRWLSRSLSRLRSSDELRSGSVFPTDIIGARCPICDAPMIWAWREVAGTKRPWRINVEVVAACSCDSDDMLQHLKGSS